jgi:hypothetical protein
MASRRTTFDKLQRERAKKAKAAAKRERRLEKSADENGDGDVAVSSDDPAELLEEIAAVHARFEAKMIDFEEFEEQKTALFERLAALPVES